MKNFFKYIFATTAIVLLGACGGGGGGGGGTTGNSNPAPVVSTSSFNLLAAYASTFANSQVDKFTVSGTVNSVGVTGSGTKTIGNTSSGTFEGQSALQRTVTVTGSLISNGISIPLSDSVVNWVTTNYLPLGQVSDEYEVVTGTAVLPTSVRVGDTGPIYTSKRYSDSSKSNLLGSEVATYVVEADTASTVLVTLIFVTKDTANKTTQQSTEQYRINTTNVAKLIKSTLLDYTNKGNITISYQ